MGDHDDRRRDQRPSPINTPVPPASGEGVRGHRTPICQDEHVESEQDQQGVRRDPCPQQIVSDQPAADQDDDQNTDIYEKKGPSHPRPSNQEVTPTRDD